LVPRSKALAVAAGIAVAAAGGLLFAWIRTPLPWMLGAIFATACAQVAGAHLRPLPGGRALAFVVVGTSLGLYFTAPVVAEVAHQWPWFVALGFAAIGFGTLSAWVLMRVGRTNRATAYFGSMPGGAAEMALMGERYGASVHSVALAHSMRMICVVTIFPVAITLAGFHATEDYRPVGLAYDPAGLALLVALTGAGGCVARLLRVPTAFMMGALVASIALTMYGVRLSSVPVPLTNAAQVLLGAALGSRFEREFLRDAPRFLLGLAPSLAVMLMCAALVGWGLSVGSGAYLGAGILAAAPGGIAEMSITAKVLRINVAFVTAAHVVRYVIVVFFTIPIYRCLIRPEPEIHR
jgi:membrane AbrB-like protein